MPKGRAKKYKPGEIPRFANLPVETVLKAESVTSLNHAAFRVLVIISGQCWYKRGLTEKKGNNGTAALTEVHAKQYGFNGRDTLYGSLRELTERGLIVITRQGLRIKNSFTLYAVGWLPVTHLNGKPLDVHIEPTQVPVPTCLQHLGYIPDYREWKVTYQHSRPSGTQAEIVTDGRECTVPKTGSDQSKYVPVVGNTDHKSLPIIGNTLRVSAELGSARSSVSSQATALPVSLVHGPEQP